MSTIRLDKTYPVLVNADSTGADEVTLKNLSPGIAYYKQEPSVSSTNKTGELSEGQEVAINERQPTWFIGAENGIILEVKQSISEVEGSVTTGDIVAEAVTAGKIAAKGVTAAKLAESSITEANKALGASSIVAGNIKTGAVVAAGLGAEAVETAAIKALNVTAGTLAAEAVETAKIKLLAVTAALIAKETITAEKLVLASIDAPQIKLLAITAALIAKETITGEKLANGTITPKQLQGGATPAYSGKVAVTAGKEEEPSATERKLVNLTVESKTTEAATYEVLVNKVWAAEMSVGAAVTAASFPTCTVLVPAAQKYEVKVLTGKAEKLWASAVTI
jgi:hypothetical protein